MTAAVRNIFNLFPIVVFGVAVAIIVLAVVLYP